MSSVPIHPLVKLLRLAHAPPMWVLRRLPNVAKFLVIAVVLLVPPLVVSLQQYKAATHQLKFNAGEHLGMRYMEPVHDLLDAQERHWVAQVARALGDKDMACSSSRRRGPRSPRPASRGPRSRSTRPTRPRSS